MHDLATTGVAEYIYSEFLSKFTQFVPVVFPPGTEKSMSIFHVHSVTPVPSIEKPLYTQLCVTPYCPAIYSQPDELKYTANQSLRHI